MPPVNAAQPQDTSVPLVEKSDLISQTSHGPTLSDVASKLMRQALQEHFPTLDLDPDKTLLVTPQWQVVAGTIEARPPSLVSLTQALVRQGLDGTRANYIEGEHFLTLEPRAEVPLHLAVSIEEVAEVLNDSTTSLFIEFQQQQLDFWNHPGNKTARWQELADALRKALNVQQVKGLDAEECAMVREVYKDPDKATRQHSIKDLSIIQAGLIDVDKVDDNITSHLLIGGALVIKATGKKRELLVMFTIERNFESFGSMARLGAVLPERLEEQLQGSALSWRLYEPDGNIFDYMAWALVASQLDAIDAYRLRGAPSGSLAAPQAGLDSIEHKRFMQLDAAIPDWLRNASPSDLQDYGLYITALGAVYRQPEHKVAKEQIPSISDHAQRLMREAIIAEEHANGAALLPLDELRIKTTSSFTADNLTLPNPFEQRLETLADFALENEAPYRASVYFLNDQAVPKWLTPDFLTRMAAQINIGDAYPKLIKRKLLDDPVESRRQENFHVAQLRWQLPLAALEGKVRRTAGIDEQGYRFIRTLLDPDAVVSKAMAIYPLAMTPQHRLIRSSDTVENMFLISARDAPHGTCLLYRPLLDQPLLQFPSRQNLLYALHQPGELRDSILAWLPDKALSFEYAQYVFPVGLPSPWLVAEQLSNPLQRAEHWGSVVFDDVEITGNILSTLYTCHAKALVTLSDRQSQSNAERRWTLLKDSSWALFNVASNFLSGTVGTAVWVWQSINEIQQAIDAHDKGERFIEWTSVGDVLLTVGIILSHHAVSRRKAVSSKPQVEGQQENKLTAPVAPKVVTLDSTPLDAELPSTHYSSLDIAGSVPRRTPTALGTFLDTLEVSAPDLTDAELSKVNATPPHLYQLHEKVYAKVAERWFNVKVDSDEQVNIIFPHEQIKTGPLLVSDGRGQWVLDLRLRLRGGGPKSRLKNLQDAKRQRRLALDETLTLARTEEAAKIVEVNKTRARVLLAKGDAYDTLVDLYLEQLEGMISTYQQTLAQLHEWRELGGTTDYVYELLRLSTETQKHLSFWFTIKKYRYAEATSVLLDSVSPEPITREKFLENVQKASDVSQEMVEKLRISNTVLEGMQAAGRPGITCALKLRGKLPTFTALQLKANEIGMAQELCLQSQSHPRMVEARNALGDLIVNAAKAAQTVTDLIKEADSNADVPGRIEVLNTLAETFADADQRLLDLPETYPDRFKQDRLDHLRSLIEEFSQWTQKRLKTLIPEDESVGQEATTSVRERPRQPVKVSKSRPRNSGGTSDAATTADEALKPFVPAPSRPSTSTLSDLQIIEAGLELNEDTSSFIERTRKDAGRPRRIPADMQDLFDQQAVKLEQSASDVERAQGRLKNPPPAASLSADLREAATQLRSEGVRIRAALYKTRKPTQNSFKWLQENQQVLIERNEQGRIQTKKMGDYFQEYRILDASDNQVLWVAHFHYANAKSPASAPTTAHLKVAEPYLKTLAPDQQQALNSVEPIDGVLRRLETPALRKLFVDLEPAT